MIVTMMINGGISFDICRKTRASIQFRKQVKQLFSSSEVSQSLFHYSQLVGLPPPVQRYFKHVLKEGQQYINYVRVRHNGKFKTGPGKKWVNILGEEYFTTAVPGFVWKGETTMFTAKDYYINGSGGLKVDIFDIYPIVNGHGSKFDQGELLRWLGESVWFPTNLLPGKNLTWEAIDNNTAKLIFRHQDLLVYYIVSFNEGDEITQLESKRYMGDNGLETWLGKPTDYQEINGMIIPLKIEAIWKLAAGDLSYAYFKLEDIQFNNPKKLNN